MATITRPGRDLAWKLNPYMGTTWEIEQTCSLISRAAVSYNSLQEAMCSYDAGEHIRDITRANAAREHWAAWADAREARLEALITRHVDSLPWGEDPTTGERFQFRPQFDGDPRGWTVRLVGLNGREVGIA